MAESIASYDTSRLIRIIRRLRLGRYYRLVIHAPVEECIAPLKQLEGTWLDGYHYSILIETVQHPYRFMLFCKRLNRHQGYILGNILQQADTGYIEINFELLPTTDIITITLVILFLSTLVILPWIVLLPLVVAPAWCYFGYCIFALFPTVAAVVLMIGIRSDILKRFETLYLKTLSVNYHLVPLRNT